MKSYEKQEVHKVKKHQVGSTPKSHSAPKYPKGDLFNALIFNISPFKVGVEKH